MPDPKIYILTGPVHSGKTTHLEKLLGGRTDISGILSPVRDNKRIFKNIHTGETFPMEAEGDEDFFEVGRYKFSTRSFERASIILTDAANSGSSMLVIDEVGPLELSRRGFYHALTSVLQTASVQQIIIVIREHMVEDVVRFIGIGDHTIITTNDVI